MPKWKRTSAGGWVGTATSALNMNTNAISGVTTLALSGAITQGEDTDISNIFGRARIDSRTTDTVNLSHYDQTAANAGRVTLTASGGMVLNTTANIDGNYTNGGTVVLRFNQQGLMLGNAAFPSTGTSLLTINNGTAAATPSTNQFTLYSADVVAGNAAPHFLTENGAVIKLYQQTGIAVTAAAIHAALVNHGLITA